MLGSENALGIVFPAYSFPMLEAVGSARDKPEPVTSGDERAIVENLLDRNRAAIVEVACGLSEDDARRRLVASLTTPIALVKHAAAAERFWFQRFLAGLDESGCDGYATPGDGSFHVTDTLAEVIAGLGSILDTASARPPIRSTTGSATDDA